MSINLVVGGCATSVFGGGYGAWAVGLADTLIASKLNPNMMHVLDWLWKCKV
jgi:hypothetical protein